MKLRSRTLLPKTAKQIRPDRAYLRRVISDERRIHKARQISHRIMELEARGAEQNAEAINRLKERQEKLLEGIEDNATREYVRSANGKLTMRGKGFVNKRAFRLWVYDLVSRVFGKILPKGTYLRMALRAKDLGTYHHMQDIVPIALGIWRNMPESKRKSYALNAENVAEAAVMHDIGKLEIPSHILRKTAELTEEDRAILRKHPGIGEKLVLRWGGSKKTASAARQHHMYPEKGYPNKRKGERMTQIGRLIDLADAVEKMSSARHGDEPKSLYEIMQEIQKQSNQFYKLYVSSFINAVREDREFMGWWQEREAKMKKPRKNERIKPRRRGIDYGVIVPIAERRGTEERREVDHNR